MLSSEYNAGGGVVVVIREPQAASIAISKMALPDRRVGTKE
jgi:hypothetical protein